MYTYTCCQSTKSDGCSNSSRVQSRILKYVYSQFLKYVYSRSFRFTLQGRAELLFSV